MATAGEGDASLDAIRGPSRVRRAPAGGLSIWLARVLPVRRAAPNGPAQITRVQRTPRHAHAPRLSRSMAADSTASFASDLSWFHSRCALPRSRCASLSSYSCCRRRRNRSVFSLLRVAFELPTAPETTVSRVLRQERPAPHLGVSATPLASTGRGVCVGGEELGRVLDQIERFLDEKVCRPHDDEA